MTRETTPIWAFMDSNAIRPVDIVVGLQAQEVGSFIRGCEAISAKVHHIQPDVIIIPERGARPFEWMMQALHQSPTQKPFDYLHLPIGTHVNLETAQLEGVKPKFKVDAIDAAVTNAMHRGVEFSRPLLIDEVQKGTTLSAATRYMLDVFKEKGIDSVLHIIAAQDNRDGALHSDKNVHYVDLLTNTNAQCEVSLITLPLIATDRRGLLNTLIPPTEIRTRANAHRMMMTVHNVEASDLFEKLTWASRNPNEMTMVLKKIKSGEFNHDDLTGEGRVMFSWIQHILTDPDFKNKHKSTDSILNWFANLMIYFQRSEVPGVTPQIEGI